MNTLRKLAVAIVALGSVSVALADPISVSELFDDSDAPSEQLKTAGYTQFVLFQANADLQLLQAIMFGTPVDFVQGVSQFRWQLFQTDENFQTPNGNDDRVWRSDDISFDDMGTANYATGAGVFLEESTYYWLSFQILNVDWLQSVYIRDVAKPPTFLSSDGLFTIFGEGPGPTPGGNSFPALSLRVRQVPEPSTLALFGIGLFGMALARRRKV